MPFMHAKEYQLSLVFINTGSVHTNCKMCIYMCVTVLYNYCVYTVLFIIIIISFTCDVKSRHQHERVQLASSRDFG